MEPINVPPTPNGSQQVSLELPADPALLVMACRMVCLYAEMQGMGERDCQRLELAVDEICTNCITHAYKRDITKKYRVTAERSEDDFLVVRVLDHGVEFDLGDVPTPDIRCPLTDRQIGGLGLMFAVKATDELCYKRTPEGENCITMRKRISPISQVAQA
jgi:serine/threonine-protein kinase RsbW